MTDESSARPKRYAAVDPGAVRVGLAVADEDGTFALPRPPVSGAGTPEQVARRIGEALADVAPTTIVMGLPLMLDGQEGTAAKKAKKLARAIRDTLSVKVILADERLSTAQATRGLAELGVRGRDARARVDSASAAVLLQSVLDRRKSRAWRPENEPPRSDRPRRPRPAAEERSERPESGAPSPSESPQEDGTSD